MIRCGKHVQAKTHMNFLLLLLHTLHHSGEMMQTGSSTFLYIYAMKKMACGEHSCDLRNTSPHEPKSGIVKKTPVVYTMKEGPMQKGKTMF